MPARLPCFTGGRNLEKVSIPEKWHQCVQRPIIYWPSKLTNSTGLNHVGYNDGSLPSVSCRRSDGDRINRGVHHFGRAFNCPSRTSRNEPSRSAKPHQCFDNSQSGLLDDGCDFSNFGNRNCFVPASTDTVEK